MSFWAVPPTLHVGFGQNFGHPPQSGGHMICVSPPHLEGMGGTLTLVGGTRNLDVESEGDTFGYGGDRKKKCPPHGGGEMRHYVTLLRSVSDSSLLIG